MASEITTVGRSRRLRRRVALALVVGLAIVAVVNWNTILSILPLVFVGIVLLVLVMLLVLRVAGRLVGVGGGALLAGLVGYLIGRRRR